MLFLSWLYLSIPLNFYSIIYIIKLNIMYQPLKAFILQSIDLE